jgi:hypothetical protein
MIASAGHNFCDLSCASFHVVLPDEFRKDLLKVGQLHQFAQPCHQKIIGLRNTSGAAGPHESASFAASDPGAGVRECHQIKIRKIKTPFRNITRNRNVISISRPLPEFGRSRFLKSIQPRAARAFGEEPGGPDHRIATMMTSILTTPQIKTTFS